MRATAGGIAAAVMMMIVVVIDDGYSTYNKAPEGAPGIGEAAM